MHISPITTSPEAQEVPRLSKPYKLTDHRAWLLDIMPAEDADQLIHDARTKGRGGLAGRYPAASARAKGVR